MKKLNFWHMIAFVQMDHMINPKLNSRKTIFISYAVYNFKNVFIFNRMLHCSKAKFETAQVLLII